jgi:hypothetical protein
MAIECAWSHDLRTAEIGSKQPKEGFFVQTHVISILIDLYHLLSR